MDLIVHNALKYVSIWLTRDEAANAEVQNKLLGIYSKCTQSNYRVVVFQSGSGDLTSLTRDLLWHTRRTIAEKAD